MDPIKEGKEIFSSIADKVKKEKICDLDNLLASSLRNC